MDVGARRVGVAIASVGSRLPQPLTTIDNDGEFQIKLQSIMAENAVTDIVVGLPRGLDGQNTRQTAMVCNFGEELKKHLKIKLHFQDEALTSKLATAELETRGKPFSRADVDALAAVYILDDWLKDNPETT